MTTFPSDFFSTLITLQLQVANNGAILIYNGNPQLGSLIGWISPVAGTDQYGNSFTAGIVFSDGTVKWNLHTGLIVGTLDAIMSTYNTSYVNESRGTDISSFVLQGGGGTSQIETLWRGPTNTGRTDAVAIAMKSSSDDGTSLGAQGVIYYFTASQGNGILGHSVLSWNFAGIQASGNLTAIEPGTGTSPSNVFANEIWHNLSLNSGYTAFGSTTATPRAQLEPINGGRVRLSGVVSLTANHAASATISTVGSAYIPSFSQSFVCANTLSGATGSNPVIHIDTSGNIVCVPAGSTNNTINLDGIVYPLD